MVLVVLPKGPLSFFYCKGMDGTPIVQEHGLLGVSLYLRFFRYSNGAQAQGIRNVASVERPSVLFFPLREVSRVRVLCMK